jgi:homoserine O-acetyltransferase
LEGVKTALITDPEWRGGNYQRPPEAGLRAMGRVWAGWALSQAFYRRRGYLQMGYDSLEDFLVRYWEAIYLARDANDILAMIDTWQRGDLSANPAYGGDYKKAMAAIRAKTLILPGATDLYFPTEDSALEAALIDGAEMRPIPSDWGHYAAGGKDPQDTAFINAALSELLAR